MTELHRYDTSSWLETIWDALTLIHPQAVTEEQHDDIMSAMNWITEELGYEFDTQPDSPTNGELVKV
jgi:aromatic ring-cleaving dioxygenase